MLEMAERYARARGAGVICLNAVSDAFRFYTRHGFRPARLRGCTRDQTAIPVKKALAPEPMRRAA
jgi:hypothetical protein